MCLLFFSSALLRIVPAKIVQSFTSLFYLCCLILQFLQTGCNSEKNEVMHKWWILRTEYSLLRVSKSLEYCINCKFIWCRVLNSACNVESVATGRPRWLQTRIRLVKTSRLLRRAVRNSSCCGVVNGGTPGRTLPSGGISTEARAFCTSWGFSLWKGKRIDDHL